MHSDSTETAQRQHIDSTATPLKNYSPATPIKNHPKIVSKWFQNIPQNPVSHFGILLGSIFGIILGLFWDPATPFKIHSKIVPKWFHPKIVPKWFQNAQRQHSDSIKKSSIVPSQIFTSGPHCVKDHSSTLYRGPQNTGLCRTSQWALCCVKDHSSTLYWGPQNTGICRTTRFWPRHYAAAVFDRWCWQALSWHCIQHKQQCVS